MKKKQFLKSILLAILVLGIQVFPYFNFGISNSDDFIADTAITILLLVTITFSELPASKE